MVDPLPDLDLRDPQMRCICLLAVVALLVGNHELNYEALLQERPVEDLLLNGELYLDAL